MWATLHVDFDDEEHAFFVALGFGTRVEVIAPTSLRVRVASEIARMFERLDPR